MSISLGVACPVAYEWFDNTLLTEKG